MHTPTPELELPGISALSTLLLGREPAQRRAVQRLFISTWFYVLYTIVEIAAGATGLLPARATYFLAAYSSVGLLTFYALARTGYSLRFADPSMVMAQLMFGIAAVGIVYNLLDTLRGAALVLLCLALVFDMHRLTPRQIVIATVSAIAMLTITLLLQWRYAPGGMDIHAEVPNVAFACLLLPALCVISLQVTGMRKRLINQKADLEEAVTRLRHLSEHDGLTGLYNRRHAQMSMDQNKCQGPPSCECCVVILDIDHFKHINDTFGHSIGDAVLRTMSTLLRDCMRGPDIVARWGGEEFLLFLPKMSGSQSVSVLQRFRKRVIEYNWVCLAPQLSVSFSAGVAECSNTERWMRTLQRADTALYEAKRTGRDRIVLV